MPRGASWLAAFPSRQEKRTSRIDQRLFAIRRAGRRAVVEDGQVVEFGTHDELIARNGTYARYYRLQFGD